MHHMVDGHWMGIEKVAQLIQGPSVAIKLAWGLPT
jgi:hypothetical protein